MKTAVQLVKRTAQAVYGNTIWQLPVNTTPRRVLRADPPQWDYLGVVRPDGADPLEMQFKSLASNAVFCRETEPHHLDIYGDDGDALRAALELLISSGHTIQ
jgi:hypothetical protein